MFIIDPRNRKMESNTDSPPGSESAPEQELGERPKPVGTDGEVLTESQTHQSPAVLSTPKKPLSEVLKSRLLKRLSPFEDYSVFDVLKQGPAS